MYPIFALLCFLSALMIGCAPSVSTLPEDIINISIVDRNGMTETTNAPDRLKQYKQVDFLKPQPYQKVIRVFEGDDKGDVRSIITSYHPNGQPKQYLEAINSRAFGRYQEWHPNGTLKLEGKVIGGAAELNNAAALSWLFDGPSQVWDEEGHLTALINYDKGVLHGMSLYYHSNGTIWKKIPYEKNEIHGKQEIFVENGDLMQFTEYTQGVKHGSSIRYWEKDRIASEETYFEGNLISGKYFDKSGKSIAQIQEGSGDRAIFGKEGLSELHQYVGGVPEGTVKVFTKSGNLYKLYHVRNNQKHGEEIFYYPGSSLPKLSIQWVDGLVNGLVKTWYENGQLESQREVAQNLKNGLSTAWYRDGNLMLLEEYEKDKLLKGEYFRKGEKTPISQVKEGTGTATLFDSEGNFLRKVPYTRSKPEE